MEWKRASSLGRASLLCGKEGVLCAWSAAAGVGTGVAMVGEALAAPFGLERGHREEEAQLEQREVPGHSQRWMVPAGKQKEGNSPRHSSDLVGLVWVFLWGMCFRHPLTLVLEAYWDLLVIISAFVPLHPDKIGLALLLPHGNGNHCSRILALPWHCALYSVCSCSNAAVTFSPHLPTCKEH